MERIIPTTSPPKKNKNAKILKIHATWLSAKPRSWREKSQAWNMPVEFRSPEAGKRRSQAPRTTM
jgi:hypothetical protein